MIGADNTGFPASVSRERQMWCSVLQQTLDDLSIKLPPAPVMDTVWRSEDSPHRLEWIRETARWQNANQNTIGARAFAFGPLNRWRETVCDFAGITEECFVRRAKAIVEGLE